MPEPFLPPCIGPKIMTMLDLKPEHQAILRAIVRRHFPQHRALVFGSRARGLAKPWSDVDLALLGEKAIDDLAMAHAREDFDESNLPFQVDLVRLNDLPKPMQQMVLRDGLPL